VNGLLDPRTLGLLSAGGAMLQASGPSRTPVSFGQVAGQGLLAGTDAYQQGLLNQSQMDYRNLQMQQQKRYFEQKQQQDDYIKQFADALPPAERSKFLIAPGEYLKELNKKFVVGGNLVSGGGQNVFTAPEKPQLVDSPVPGQPGVSQPTWVRPGEAGGTAVGGQKMPEILNPAVQAARVGVAEAGRPSVTVENYPNPMAVNRDGKPAMVQFGKTGAMRETPYTPYEPGGVAGESAGRVAMSQQGITNIEHAKSKLFTKDGALNKTLILKMSIPGFAGMPNDTDARETYSAVRTAIEARLRLETGAAAPEAEVNRVLSRFLPTIMDTSESARFKLDQLQEFFESALKQTKGIGPAGVPTQTTAPAPAGIPKGVTVRRIP